MFFREKKTRKTRVLQQVENRRDSAGKVRQRVVVSLGGCPVPDEHRKRVAVELTRRRRRPARRALIPLFGSRLCSRS